ncbi:MAG: MarC family protein [Deltaproteobacteria bacterium]|nr:MarC family protein [Deltaproteobacteria bacterium]
MADLFHNFWLTFIPLFVAMGIIENVPIFLTLTENFDKSGKHRIVRQSMITAAVIIVGFVFIGNWVLRMLGITIADFTAAGGLLLLVISIKTLVEDESLSRSPETAGVVPLGTPLIAGPAILTVSLLLVNLYGLFLTLFSCLLCILLQAVSFYRADWLGKILGKGGSKAFAKIGAIVLAAIAVMLIRRGVLEIVQTL